MDNNVNELKDSFEDIHVGSKRMDITNVEEYGMPYLKTAKQIRQSLARNLALNFKKMQAIQTLVIKPNMLNSKTCTNA